MPVSISFLNSLSGFSTSAAGFMLSNKALVVTGAFVGCSGIILTLVMCRAMNRSVAHVLIGGFGEGSPQQQAQKSATEGAEQGTVQQVSAEDVIDLLTDARSVIVVPGYGMVSSPPIYMACLVVDCSSNSLSHSCDAFPTVMAGRGQGPALDCRSNTSSPSPRSTCPLCDPSSGGSHAGPYECLACVSPCPFTATALNPPSFTVYHRFAPFTHACHWYPATQ